MMFNDSFVLMLSYVDNEWLDIAGNKYPEQGYVEANEFSDDRNIQKGLYGIPWGVTSYFVYEQIDQPTWFVVKVQKSDTLIKINNRNRFKFKDGFVVHHGEICSCSTYIWENKDSPEMLQEASSLQLKDVAGSEDWFIAYNNRWR